MLAVRTDEEMISFLETGEVRYLVITPTISFLETGEVDEIPSHPTPTPTPTPIPTPNPNQVDEIVASNAFIDPWKVMLR